MRWDRQAFISAVYRFFRTIAPQTPAIIAYLQGWKPEHAALFALLGAIITAIDKYLRDITK